MLVYLFQWKVKKILIVLRIVLRNSASSPVASLRKRHPERRSNL